MDIDLDIVIVNWNTGIQLRECLQSISSSALSSSESNSVIHIDRCIVVDNASGDHSADGLEGLPILPTVLRNPQNKGFAKACNQGAKLGNASYLLFLNPDMKLMQNSLCKALVFLNRPEAEGIGILGIQLIDPQGRIQRNTARFSSPGNFISQMLGLDRLWPSHFPTHFMTEWDHQQNREVDQVPGAFFLARRKLFEQLDGFDERFFMYFEDLDFAYRARKAGWKSYYCAEAQALHHGGGASEQVKANRLFYILRSRVLYIAKHYGTLPACEILLVSLTGELWARLAWSLIQGSGKSFMETLSAYWKFIGGIPKLISDITREPECASSL